MIVKVNRGEFLKKLRTVEKAVSENKIKPIISCVYLEAKEENTLFFCGTNLELTITSIMESEVLEKGKIVFQPQIIDEYVKELSDDVILLKSEDSTLIIETGDSSSEFSLMNADEFPMVAGKNNALAKYCFTIASRELLEIFENVNLSEFFEIIFKISITLLVGLCSTIIIPSFIFISSLYHNKKIKKIYYFIIYSFI